LTEMDRGSWDLTFAHKAAKAFAKLPFDSQQRIAPKIEALKVDPRPRGCEKLEGLKGVFRIRIGDYRVVYEIHEATATIMVAHVAHRRDVYKGL
jgi:mRNA interferase RelE/StbE